MSIHIIIDGYNLIRQSQSLSLLDDQDIQMGREALVDTLSAYRKRKSHRITVVFDGTQAPPFSPPRDRKKGITIKFSRPGESADAVIKRMARQEKENALVVTSDREIVNSAAASGAATISARNFEDKLVRTTHQDGGGGADDELKGWTPNTQKKGPRRRFSKRLRKNRAKIKRL
ncbi:MAG: NYN domain-containing protein [Desulfobacterales bacterium]|nr:MAG: NYN domain-containing protein [Desulfobacterales bacterium]